MGDNISRDEWLAALGDTVKPLNPDALTVTEMADLFGCGRQATYSRLKKLVREGAVTRTYKRTLDCDGRSCVRPAYLLLKKPTCRKKSRRA
jgi:hypothetical protein